MLRLLLLLRWLLPLGRLLLVTVWATGWFLWALIVDYKLFEKLFTRQEWDGTLTYILTGK